MLYIVQFYKIYVSLSHEERGKTYMILYGLYHICVWFLDTSRRGSCSTGTPPANTGRMLYVTAWQRRCASRRFQLVSLTRHTICRLAECLTGSIMQKL